MPYIPRFRSPVEGDSRRVCEDQAATGSEEVEVIEHHLAGKTLCLLHGTQQCRVWLFRIDLGGMGFITKGELIDMPAALLAAGIATALVLSLASLECSRSEATPICTMVRAQWRAVSFKARLTQVA